VLVLPIIGILPGALALHGQGLQVDTGGEEVIANPSKHLKE